MRLILRHDLRAAPFGAPHSALYKAAIDQSIWADKVGFHTIMTHEHHCEDGYIPSPLVLAAAIAGATRQARIEIRIALLPLYDPIRMAEDWAVLDLISEGRADVVVAVGYRRYEFALFGVDYDTRGQRMDEAIAIIKQAWTGEPFEYRGQTVQITPRPYRQPRPPIYFGGNSKAAARRAAREGDGFFPPPNSTLIDFYQQECRRLGKTPGPDGRMDHNGNIAFVAEDPAAAWDEVGRYLLYQHNAYAVFAVEAMSRSTEAQATFPFKPATTRQELADLRTYLIVSPDEAVRMAKESGVMVLQPLAGGIPPDLARKSLDLVERKVLPALG